MSFTKGPWQQDKYGSVQDASGESIQFRGVSTLCSGSEKRIAEAEANTRLIASAPDLLESLKAALEELRAMKDEIGFRANTLDVIRQCEATIAKVRGEA